MNGNLSIVVKEAGRPAVTSRVRSLTVVRVSDVQAQDRAAPSGRLGKTRESTPPLVAQAPDKGSGLGDRAREALVQSQTTPETGAVNLSPDEQAVVKELAARDREVRAHEEAHARVGGNIAGSPSYSYQTGPDGRRYAIGGEVPIDVAPVPGDPEATIDKMQIVKAAALAPAEPSSTDRRVAALAESQKLEAMAELAAQKAEVRTGALGEQSIGSLAEILSRDETSENGSLLSLAA